MKGRRIMRVTKIQRGALGIYRNEFIYEYSEILKSWVGWPDKWYRLREEGFLV